MTEHKWFLRVVGAFVFTAACSNEAAKNDDMVVQGTVAQNLRTSNVQAVALGADGRSFWSALDARGDFKLTIPAGQSYRIVLADRGADGKAVSVAFLAITTGTGKTKWVLGKSGTTLRLGTLLPAGTLASTQSTGVKPQSGSTGTMTSADGTSTDTADTAEAGSGRGGSGRGGDDGSGRGGSGRGSDDGSGRGGSGRGGADGADDDHDDFDDDQGHADDPPCHEGGHDDAVCPGGASAEMESSRNGADDVSECADSAHADDDAACTGAAGGGSSGTDGVPAAPEAGSSGSSGAVSSSGSVPPAGGAGASSGSVNPGVAAPPASPGVN